MASGLLEMADARISECASAVFVSDGSVASKGSYGEIAQAVGPVRSILSSVIRKPECVSHPVLVEVAAALDSTTDDIREQLFMHFELIAVSASASFASVGAHVTVTTPILQLFWFLSFPDLDEVPVDRFVESLKGFLVDKCALTDSETSALFSSVLVTKLSLVLDSNRDALVRN